MIDSQGCHRVALCAGVVLVTGMAGCSMHPLPGDLPRKSTFEIVEKIRCEGAEALRGIPKGHKFLQTTYIGYDFDFDIKETNNAGQIANGSRGKLTFTDKHNSQSSVELTGAAERERKAQRTFRIIESLDQLKTADCSPQRTRENWMYPITGSIGMYEIVRTYVGLERITTLVQVSVPSRDDATFSGDTIDPPGDPSNVPVVFSDVLVYTTKLGAGAKPNLVLNAAGIGSFKLTGATLFADASREDVHKLTVVLARSPLGAEPPAVQRAAVNTPAATRAQMRAQNTKVKEDEYKNAIRSYQVNPVNNFSNNLSPSTLVNAPYGTRYVRTLDALEQKQLPADTRVYVELERRRASEEDDAYLNRIIEILKPSP